MREDAWSSCVAKVHPHIRQEPNGQLTLNVDESLLQMNPDEEGGFVKPTQIVTLVETLSVEDEAQSAS